MKKIAVTNLSMISSMIVPALCGTLAFGASSDGWENAHPARRMPVPAKEVWRAPLEKGMEAFRVDWRGGATGTVTVADGVLRIEKGNADGMVVVTAEPFAMPKGSLLQGYAACYDETPVDPFEASAYVRLWSGKEDMRWERRHFNGTTSDSPLFLQLVNTPSGQFTRKLCRTRVGNSGQVTAAIVVEGPPSVTVWRNWGVEDAVAADHAWKRRNAASAPPDRSDTLMDESAFDAALAADTEHSARMVQSSVGGELEVDGKPVPPILYKPTPFGHGVPFTGGGRALEGAGVNLQTVNIRLGVGFGRIGFWSTNGFDCAGAVRRVKDFMRSAPHSLFFVTIRCDAYPEYADEHPDEKWLRPDGTVVYGSCSQGQKKASSKPPLHTWPWVSNHSLVWRNDVKRLMSEFVAELKRTGLAKRIVGVHLAGYHDGQFAVPVADFSKPAAAAFRAWQKETYGRVKWAEAPVFPKGQELLNPVRDEAQIAYQKFLKWGPMRMQEDFARHLKAAFGKPIVVGRWCMNTFGGSIMATLDFTPFTHSDALDFLVAQPHYCRRAPGLDCAVRPPLGSFRLHGKMFLNEFDLRTWTGRSGENEARGIFLSEATDLPMWESLHRKLAGQMFANRMGWWYFDMSDNWFSDPGILADIASVRRSAETLLPPKVGTASAQFAWKPSVAVVVDEEGLMLRNRIGIDLSMREVKNTPWQMQDFGASAVPYDIVLAQDFMDNSTRIDGYKVAVMSGFYQIDERRAALIAALRQKGVKLVFLADSGACGGAEACKGSVQIDEPRGLTPKMLNALVREAGGYVPSRTGIQVDMNGDFISIHCLMTGHYDFALPFAADVENLKTGKRLSAAKSIPLDMTGGETRWYRLIPALPRTATGWVASKKPPKCRLLPGRGRDGGDAMAIYGAAEGKDEANWTLYPISYRPDTCYGVSFWVNRYRTGSEIVLENEHVWQVYSSHVTSGWTELKTVFKTPDVPTNMIGKLILHEYMSQGETLFDQPRLVELVPEWRKADGLELGHGEFVCGNLYSFVTHLRAPACAVTRPFVGVRNGARTGIKCDVISGGELLYRFALPERRFTDAEATITCAHRRYDGHAIVEASWNGGAEWMELACVTGAIPYNISFPAKMFPCDEVLLRVRMVGKERDRVHISMVGFSGHFEGRPARLAGATRFIEKDTGSVFLEASPNDYRVETFGERLSVTCDGIAFWRASSGRKVMRDAVVPEETASVLAVKTAANEAEAVQLVVTPQHDVQDVRIALEAPLVARSPDLSKIGEIPAEAVQVLREHYLDITITTDQRGTRGLWPDALPPQDDSPWPAKAGESTPFWVRVKPPKGTPKGIYGGDLAVDITRKGHPPEKVRVPFEVEVFGFDLPDRMTVTTAFGFNPDTVYRYHRATNDADKAAIRELYMKYLGDNHISPYPLTVAQPVLKWKDNKDPVKASLAIDWDAFDREASHLLDTYHFNSIKVKVSGVGGGNHNTRSWRGVPQIAGAKRGEAQYECLMEMYLGQIQRHLEEKGWIDYSYFYWFDEPMGPDYEYVNAGMRTLKKYAPKIKRMITNRCTEDLMEAVDTWCPIPEYLHVPALEKCRVRGDNLWWYICCSPPATLIGEHIDHPGTDLRTWLWQTWGEGVSGILCWAVGWWTGKAAYPDMDHPQDPYLDPVGWEGRFRPGVKMSTWCNGEGRFMYPPLAARNGRQANTVIEGPVSCIRMEMLRDGIEDYEYFAMLKRCDPGNLLLAVPKAVYRALDDYSADPTHMETHREKLARAIEQLQRR